MTIWKLSWRMLTAIFCACPDLRLKVAIYRYQQDEISLAKAAHLADVS